MEGIATPTSSGSETTGPTSFADPGLTWSDASSASTPATEPAPADPASASATETPAATEPDTGQPPQHGEPPKERWADILQNARTKAGEEALAQWKQQYGWAEQVNPQELQQLQSIARHFLGGDAITGLRSFIAELSKDPQVGAALRTMHAQELAALRGQKAAETQEPQPDLPIELADGRVVHVYTAAQQAKREAWLHEQWMARVKQEMQPLQQSHQQQQHALAEQQRMAVAERHAHDIFSELSALPGMNEAAMEQMTPIVAKLLPGSQPKSPEAVSLAAYRAYQQVVVPTLQSKGESSLLDDLKRKAAASTSVNPASAAASSPGKVSSFFDKSLQW